MLITIPSVLTQEVISQCKNALENTQWSDGKGSAGYLSQAVKQNLQLPDNHPLARELGQQILTALEKNETFNTAALPVKIVPPLFNCYQDEQSYGRHIDGAIRPITGTPLRVRTDLSATLFLSDPEEYDGGELVIEDTYGPREIKLKAGDMVLYPGTSIHKVKPVTRGRRLASFFWIQSMIREDHQRTILYELDCAIQKIATETPEQSALMDLAGIYHNLLRTWADT